MLPELYEPRTSLILCCGWNDKIESMSVEEIEKALGVPGAASSWDSFGPLMIQYRIGLHPTSAWGTGNGVANQKPGWIASMSSGGTVHIDTDPLLAGCKCLLLEKGKRHWDSEGNLID